MADGVADDERKSVLDALNVKLADVMLCFNFHFPRLIEETFRSRLANISGRGPGSLDSLKGISCSVLTFPLLVQENTIVRRVVFRGWKKFVLACSDVVRKYKWRSLTRIDGISMKWYPVI